MNTLARTLVVTHAYAVRFPHYAAFLRYQLASLEACPGVKVAVCYCMEDEAVSSVVRWFSANSSLVIREFIQSAERLGRRCIGRNHAAVSSSEDFVFFTDVDHVFDPEVFADIPKRFDESWPGAAMIFPRQIMIHRDHATGDAAAQSAIQSVEMRPVIDKSQFVPKLYGKAIGGVQIVRGDFARQHGYLANDPKWQVPRTDGKPFGDFRDDIAYRGFCLQYGEIKGVDLPGIWRLRHSTTSYQW